MRHNKENSISELIKAFVKSSPKLEGGINNMRCKEAWLKVMGENMSKYTEIVSFKNDTMYVRLNSSVALEELGYSRESIIKSLNEALGNELIKKLILR